jgi:transcriptional regulator with XRE-family HTH domain
MVGANIRELRLQRGMTQEALALTSGVTRNVLIDVEQGKRGLLYERLFDIAEALQVSVGALLEGSAGSGCPRWVPGRSARDPPLRGGLPQRAISRVGR